MNKCPHETYLTYAGRKDFREWLADTSAVRAGEVDTFRDVFRANVCHNNAVVCG